MSARRNEEGEACGSARPPSSEYQQSAGSHGSGERLRYEDNSSCVTAGDLQQAHPLREVSGRLRRLRRPWPRVSLGRFDGVGTAGADKLNRREWDRDGRLLVGAMRAALNPAAQHVLNLAENGAAGEGRRGRPTLDRSAHEAGLDGTALFPGDSPPSKGQTSEG